MFIKSCPKSRQSVLKSDIFQSSQRSPQLFGLQLLQASSLRYFKIAQSGHTGKYLNWFFFERVLKPLGT